MPRRLEGNLFVAILEFKVTTEIDDLHMYWRLVLHSCFDTDRLHKYLIKSGPVVVVFFVSL